MYDESRFEHSIIGAFVFHGEQKLALMISADSGTPFSITISSALLLIRQSLSLTLASSDCFDYILGSLSFGISGLSTLGDPPVDNILIAFSRVITSLSSSLVSLSNAFGMSSFTTLCPVLIQTCFPSMSITLGLGIHFFSRSL